MRCPRLRTGFPLLPGPGVGTVPNVKNAQQWLLDTRSSLPETTEGQEVEAPAPSSTMDDQMQAAGAGATALWGAEGIRGWIR